MSPKRSAVPGVTVDVAHNGTDGLWFACEHDYDVIILGVMMPAMVGYQVCSTLRREENWTPILFLTAKDGEWDEVEGLDTGADDWLTKPFSHPVLVARLHPGRAYGGLLLAHSGAARIRGGAA